MFNFETIITKRIYFGESEIVTSPKTQNKNTKNAKQLDLKKKKSYMNK